MNLLPVIERELIAEARHASQYWLRMAGASALTGMGVLYGLSGAAATPNQGLLLFERMTLTLQLILFVLVPVMTADCISREKREGTLGLLFLTPLRAREIIMGKVLIHAIRAATMVVASFPVLCLPLMMGGVDLRAILHALATSISALVIALTASLHASVRNTEMAQAVTQGLGICLLCSLPFWTCLSFPVFSGISALVATPFVLVLSYLALERSAVHLASHWRIDLMHPPDTRWSGRFRGSAFLRRRWERQRRRALEINPVIWLQEHSIQRRVAGWGWFLIMFGAAPAGSIFAGRFMDYSTWLAVLTVALAAGAAFIAANSFRQDTESLELLLVTPLRPHQILTGRMIGIMKRFFPALLILGFYWMIPILFGQETGVAHWTKFAISWSSMLALPLVGLWAAFRKLPMVAAWLASMFVGFALPLAVATAILQTGAGPVSIAYAPVFFVIVQLSLAGWCYGQVDGKLKNRTFAVPDSP